MPEISKIKIQDSTVYDIKDAEVRHIIDILLGNESTEHSEIIATE